MQPEAPLNPPELLYLLHVVPGLCGGFLCVFSGFLLILPSAGEELLGQNASRKNTPECSIHQSAYDPFDFVPHWCFGGTLFGGRKVFCGTEVLRCVSLRGILPVQRIFRLWDDEQSVHSIEDIPHGDLGVVVPVKDVVADAAHAVDVAVVHLCSC